MAKGLDITLIGDLELMRKFERLPVKMQRKVFRQAARKAAKPILASAKAKVPVKTGVLKKSLKIKSLKRSRNKFGVTVGTGSGDLVFSDETFYGAFVELGTKRSQAKPFLRPALEENRARGLEILRREIWAGVKREAKS